LARTNPFHAPAGNGDGTHFVLTCRALSRGGL
jgi:hypothetical protein